MIVIFRFLFATGDSGVSISSNYSGTLAADESESVEARFPSLGKCRHTFFPIAAADQSGQGLKPRAPGAA
jgi:hypothetical protein